MAIAESRHHIMSSSAFTIEKHFCFDHFENIADYPVSLFMRKTFENTSAVNRAIRQLIEGGIFVKWQRDFQSKNQRKQEPPILTASLKSLSFAFGLLYGGGLSLAIFSFTAEIVIVKQLKKNDHHLIWNYLDRFFDGHRHPVINP